ncbi:hypothetical protein HYPSUDRAFT_36378 [Hypholoma sublateritium FD-334 SS-4]|uniref:Acyltransferase 3 domain-containing protein n=1 Tax=Hypholoma sublateritium (strain FD-334 SS-4) TaxID=945553 RepID=A0A0D2Q538_HYPSF|nr:hypothetical protein HYPSUDRAFT_36378 [Hypholoma sublateritium FD-334 SS-4]
MITNNETTPLLGEPSATGQSSSARNSSNRIHFVDNLRAVLTVLLIFHHAAIFSARDSIRKPNYQNSNLLPLALFITTNKSFLYQSFFFVSGYSIHLALASKSDLTFFVSRTLKTGVPALIWLRFRSVLGTRQAEGPGSYVFTLLLFDYIYLSIRFAGRKWPAISLSRLEAQIKASHRKVLALTALSFILVTGITIGNCFHLRLIPFIYRRYYPFEFPGFGNPVAYIIAYIAGVNFPIVKRYILTSRVRVAVGYLVGSESAAYITLGIAQHLCSDIWEFIKPTFNDEGARYFDNPGLNLQTIFFSLWSPLAFFLITISLVSVFACAPALQKKWGVLTEHTYLQTFIHMIPIALAGHLLSKWSVTDIPVVKAVISASCGVIISWALAIVFVLVRRRYSKHISKEDVQTTVRNGSDIEAIGS